VESKHASSDDQSGTTQTDITFRWKESVLPKVFQFSDESGINAEVLSMLTEEPTSLDHFRPIFVHDHLLDILVRETNIYAKQYTDATNLKTHSRVRQWKPTTRCEMKLFLTQSMLMGLIKNTTH